MPPPQKQVLLIDADDARRETRVAMLKGAGYETRVSRDYAAAGRADEEATYDLVIIAVHREKLAEVTAYSEQLRQAEPTLPILLLTDEGVLVPDGTRSRNMSGGSPDELLREIARMLATSRHIRGLPPTRAR